jgi:hypothetical protein
MVLLNQQKYLKKSLIPIGKPRWSVEIGISQSQSGSVLVSLNNIFNILNQQIFSIHTHIYCIQYILHMRSEILLPFNDGNAKASIISYHCIVVLLDQDTPNMIRTRQT